ncbi:MAG: ATP-binding cassette domain-containing protein [Deltaproteobacteria bacterium]|nr:ATP-binding cassette domain-containing protein [Deltaproteobacteria bacterium]
MASPTATRIAEGQQGATVVSRALRTTTAVLRLSTGEVIECRRFIPVGKGDLVFHQHENLFVFAKKDRSWVEVGRAWTKDTTWRVARETHQIKFKEIESDDELSLFHALRKFHYRGGGGAGRVVPLIGVATTWDLPQVLGFIEVSSSMIANTARKRFFSHPYREAAGHGWSEWNRTATKKYSNMVARISRFVIHPEIRGLGLARHFLKAAMEYAAQHWHYGGYRPRFLEITADMLRYYKFVGDDFVYLGETEGNAHRISKDMTYLVKKALSRDGARAMPQGGGGVMTMQRGYASQLIKYMRAGNRSLGQVIGELHYEPQHLDQDTWEALYRLNRRPKPCYAAGLTPEARDYLQSRGAVLNRKEEQPVRTTRNPHKEFVFERVAVSASAELAQSNDSRRIQDAFGFVGATVEAEIIQPTSFVLKQGTVTMVCGASGSGKSLFGHAIRALCDPTTQEDSTTGEAAGGAMSFGGRVNINARVEGVEQLDLERTALEQIDRLDLDFFFEVCAHCGLAEPQLFVRQVRSLSSGQQYRLKIARAFLHRPDILYIDNFCEPLDRHTVAAVCRGLRRLAKKMSVAVLVSTAAYERLFEILRPSQVILLRRGNPPIVQPVVEGGT